MPEKVGLGQNNSLRSLGFPSLGFCTGVCLLVEQLLARVSSWGNGYVLREGARCVCGRTEAFLSGAQRELEGEAAVSNSPAFPEAQGSECGLQGSRFSIAVSPSLCA